MKQAVLSDNRHARRFWSILTLSLLPVILLGAQIAVIWFEWLAWIADEPLYRLVLCLDYWLIAVVELVVAAVIFGVFLYRRKRGRENPHARRFWSILTLSLLPVTIVASGMGETVVQYLWEVKKISESMYDMAVRLDVSRAVTHFCAIAAIVEAVVAAVILGVFLYRRQKRPTPIHNTTPCF